MEAPFTTLRVGVPPAWIDINGHMNATHYGLVVYDAHVRLTGLLGLADRYTEATGCGKVVLESHMIYEREVLLGHLLEVRSWLLAVDEKRLHFFHELYNDTLGCRAAAAEQVDLHVDLRRRRSTPFAPELYARLQAVVTAHLAQPRPAKVGSVIRPPGNPWLK